MSDDMPKVWRRSSRCAGNGSCVEIAFMPAGPVGVRVSCWPDQPLWFSGAEWQAFIDGVRDGEFDLRQA